MGNLKVENLTYQNSKPMTFSILSGQCAFLHGPSGAGKTLLLRSIADLEPHGGLVFLDNKECLEFKAPSWRKQVALLPPDPLWWYPTVGEHLPSIKITILHNLGFEKDVLDWNIQRLSMGERKRLAVARLFIHQPKCLLLDEPTANLDQKNSEKVETLLLTYKREKRASILWVSHDKEQMERIGEKIFYMQNKNLVQEENL